MQLNKHFNPANQADDKDMQFAFHFVLQMALFLSIDFEGTMSDPVLKTGNMSI